MTFDDMRLFWIVQQLLHIRLSARIDTVHEDMPALYVSHTHANHVKLLNGGTRIVC